ncbi:MAG TPA: hypothetical protein VF491_09385, partial [Vicinamibacterales bacterium]
CPEEGVTIVVVGKGGKESESVVAGNFTYAGEILGDDPATTEVRLTIAGGIVEGYVLTSTDWWFIEPLARFDPKAGSDQYLVYVSRETGFSAELENDSVSGEVFDYPVKDDKIPLAMVADLEYFHQSGDSFIQVMQRHATLVNGVNGIYRMQFGREFRVPRVVLDLGVHLRASGALDLLSELKRFITPEKLVQLQSHIAHLTTGKDLDAGRLGIGEQRGFRSLSEQSTTLAFRNKVIAAREISRNFSSTSQASEEHCFVVPPTCLVHTRTLDWEGFDGTVIARFSDGRQGPARNNVRDMCLTLAIRGFACQ